MPKRFTETGEKAGVSREYCETVLGKGVIGALEQEVINYSAYTGEVVVHAAMWARCPACGGDMRLQIIRHKLRPELARWYLDSADVFEACSACDPRLAAFHAPRGKNETH